MKTNEHDLAKKVTELHKLSLYLNDNQYSKLEALSKESPYNDPEEYANQFFYDSLLYKWLKYKEEQLTEYMSTPGFWDEEEEAPNPEYMYDGIYCDGDLAVIEDITLQRINGKLHYLVITPDGTERVPCIEAAEDQFEKILKKHGAKLNNLTWEDLNKVIAGR